MSEDKRVVCPTCDSILFASDKACTDIASYRVCRYCEWWPPELLARNAQRKAAHIMNIKPSIAEAIAAQQELNRLWPKPAN